MMSLCKCSLGRQKGELHFTAFCYVFQLVSTSARLDVDWMTEMCALTFITNNHIIFSSLKCAKVKCAFYKMIGRPIQFVLSPYQNGIMGTHGIS